jgi:isochorismate hydrolase
VYYAADGTASLNEKLHVAALCNIAAWAGHVVTSADIVRRLGPKKNRSRP